MTTNMSFSAISADLEEIMKTLSFTEELSTFIVSRIEDWPNFGKKNSHLYRKQLYEMMQASGMTGEAKLAVHFFMAVIKNSRRAVKAMDMMSDELKQKSWFSGTRDFLATKCAQYVTVAEREKKFPAVNIPGTNPGLDIMFWCMITKDKDRTLDNLKERVTFCQIALNDEMQGIAKQGYQNYWDNVVKGTKNPDIQNTRIEEPRMREEYYANPASDRYPLLNLELKVVPITTGESGYNRKDIIDYLASFNAPST
jgi:hypothetical protein